MANINNRRNAVIAFGSCIDEKIWKMRSPNVMSPPLVLIIVLRHTHIYIS